MNAAPAINREMLRAEVAMAAAAQAAGHEDFGDPGFIYGLRIFLDDLRERAQLTDFGVQAQFQDVVRLLVNRLGFARDLKAHPEIRDEVIAPPIIIFGLPRTGSSKLQRMIAADPAMQRLDFWKLMFPAPLPGTKGVTPDPRIEMTQQIEQMLKDLSPQAMAAHPMEALEPDEELWLMEMSFAAPVTWMKVRAPRHRVWTEARDTRPVYAYTRELLQYLQWQDGGGRGRPWVLKSPVHIGELPALLDVFPDATLVHCHRHPAKVVPSFCSLIEHSRKVHSDAVEPRELGAEFNAYWALQTRRNLDARRVLPADRMLDVYFDDIREQPLAVIEQIYARAGHRLSAEARRAFADYDARRPENHFGAHHYTLEHFGLSLDAIERAFADYLHAFPRLRGER